MWYNERKNKIMRIEDEPHLDTIDYIAIAFVIGIILFSAYLAIGKCPKHYNFDYQPKEESVVRQTNIHYYPQAHILASIRTDEPRSYLEEKIPFCESSGDPKICNKEFGCIGGMGLWGFVSRTWNSTLDRMEKEGVYMPEECWEKAHLPMSAGRIEAVFNAECNDIAGRWLLKTDGTRHWGCPTCDWGSWKCWNN